MKIHYAGKYSGNELDLPQRKHEPNAVAFKEADMKTMSVGVNIASIILFIIFEIILYLIHGTFDFSFIGALLSLVCIIPHEFLHAICFKEDAYIYQNIKQGVFFVVGTEDMSKKRFIFMCLLPNIIFGFIPFVIACFIPDHAWIGTLGSLAIGMGAGDYYNVYNAITQMPKRSRTYLCGFHSYWYLPQQKDLI